MIIVKARLCFIGNMLGRNPGFVTTQGQIVADLFAGEGFEVVSTSPKIGKVARLFDIYATVFKNRKRFDVAVLEVYSGLSMVMADASSLLCRMLGIPLIAVLHGGNLPAFTRRNPRWCRRVLSRANRLVSPSTFMAKELSNLGLQIDVIPNVIEIDRYPFLLRKKVSPALIWMRSFHENYNPSMAIRVLANLKKRFPEASLVMAGNDKGELAKTKILAEKLGVADSVRFAGFLDHESKIREFAGASIYLNTNHVDNMPVSVLEAGAFGLPVVATRVGGIPHLLSADETGLLVDDNDDVAMADAVVRLIADARLASLLSGNGRSLAERSSWESVRKDWVALFDEVLEDCESRMPVAPISPN